MKKRIACGLTLAVIGCGACAAESGDSVVVVYNKNLRDSKKLAEYYAEKRSVPSRQLFGVDVNANSEEISRADFRDRIQRPLFDWLVKEKLFTLNTQSRVEATNAPYRPIADAKIRYMVLCYGMPLTITRDPTRVEEGMATIPEPLRGRNEAAVDADLALLPAAYENIPLTGPFRSPFYLSTNGPALHPTNGIVLVTRLDGPTPEIARGLVDKALQAEANGLWGRAYFDARGITNGDYRLGDDWMRVGAEIARRFGFETTLDDNPATFAADFPMSQIAFYAGWYDASASGPFTQPKVEFMPGAFAYHLHSFSAATLRSKTEHWVGPLLAEGATISMGCVAEPYLAGTPNIAAFLEHFGFRRFSFGEAAYSCQPSLSWQTTVVGDPLYRPFGQPPDVLHYKLEQTRNPLVEWSHLRVVDLNEANGMGADDLLKYIEQIPTTFKSAVLTEKRGDLYRKKNSLTVACDAYTAALKLKPSPQQKIRLLMNLGELQTQQGQNQAALDAYKQLIKEVPDYPGAVTVYQHLASLADKLGKKSDAEKYTKEVQRITGPPK